MIYKLSQKFIVSSLLLNFVLQGVLDLQAISKKKTRMRTRCELVVKRVAIVAIAEICIKLLFHRHVLWSWVAIHTVKRSGVQSFAFIDTPVSCSLTGFLDFFKNTKICLKKGLRPLVKPWGG
jgi:hypothetical protein